MSTKIKTEKMCFVRKNLITVSGEKVKGLLIQNITQEYILGFQTEPGKNKGKNKTRLLTD